jgi:DNA helicase HerA-like ATPase
MIANQTIETFIEISGFTLNNMRQDEPSCFNGNVRVRKYRVTVELIDEPEEVIRERIQKLWDECNNHHHWQPLKNAAKQYGLDLK